MRAGAAFFATALANAGLAESNVGSVMQAPSPRSTCRRERLRWRSRAMFRLPGFMSVRRGDGSLGTHLLEWRRIDHAHQQGREPAAVVVEALHDAIDGFHVVILGATAGGVGEQLGADRTVEIGAVPGDEDALELAETADRLAADHAL